MTQLIYYSNFVHCFFQEKLNSHKAVLVVSAHWEESDVTIQTTKKPDLYFDYYGFPPETYKLTWPAVGAPDLAKKIQNLLECKGIKCKTNSERGYDHGVFVPFKLIFPDPKVPGTIILILCNSITVCSFI